MSVLDALLPTVRKGSIYDVMAHCEAAQFEDVGFAGMYADKGRPSFPPRLVLQVVLVAFHDGVGDVEAEDRCRYDFRWKYALGLRLDEDGPDATTICKFRARLIATGRAGAAFMQTLLWAREHKVLGRKIDELADATAVLGAGAVQNTLTRLRKARRKVARSRRGHAAHAEWAVAVLAAPDEKPEIAWNDAAARKAALNRLVGQGKEALARTEGLALTAEQYGGPRTAADGAGPGRGA